jgi:1,4-dihydroxy-2-naphthoate octaprenyltransferase
LRADVGTDRQAIERRAALTALKVGMYLAVVFALLAVWLIHWAVGLALLLILAPVVLWRFRRYWKEAETPRPN